MVTNLSKKVCAAFDSLLPTSEQKFAKVCDFGAGTGLIGLHFLERTEKLVAIDCSQGMIDTLSKKVQDARVEPICADLLSSSPETVALLEDQKFKHAFDLLVTSMALHHIPDLKKTFSVFAKLLKPQGGVLLLADMKKTELAPFFHPHKIHVDHPHGFSQEDLRELAKETGAFDTEGIECASLWLNKVAEDLDGKEHNFEIIVMKATTK